MVNNINKLPPIILVGIVVNSIMGISGISVFIYTKSFSVLMDGAFSFIIGLLSFWAYKIAKTGYQKKDIKKYVHFKSILMIALICMFLTEAVYAISKYAITKEIEDITHHSVLVVYGISMFVICMTLFGYYKHKLNETKLKILRPEMIQAFNDGLISIGVVIGLVLSGIVGKAFLDGIIYHLADSMLVIIVGLYCLKEPIKLLRENKNE